MGKGEGSSIGEKGANYILRKGEKDKAKWVGKEMCRRLFFEGVENSRFFQDTSDALKQAMFEATVPVFVEEGDLLFEQGNYGQLLYVVITAEMEAERLRPSGETLLAEIKQGRAMSEHCVLMNAPHEYTASVLKEGLILAIHRLQYQVAVMSTKKFGVNNQSQDRYVCFKGVV